MSRHSLSHPLLTCLGAVLALSILPTAASQAADAIQTGDGLLKVQAEMPEQIRVGDSFSYNVTVSNTSDNVVLHNIKLEQAKAKGLTIESVSVQNADEAKKKTSEQPSGKQMSIAMLMPGDSRTFKVTATADEEGDLQSCLEVTSYTPAICLTSKVVKPQLELTKTAPKEATRCEMIELQYELKNGGSGDVGAITVTDSLGEGLVTIDGENELSFNIDGLVAGDTRKFVARVYAQKPGEFSSRAVAKATEDDLDSRSKQTTTKVISADLAAKLTGPNRLYGNELARFTAHVTNTGNTAAEDVRVQVKWPQAANLVDIGQASMSKKQSAKNDDPKNKKQGQPTPANDKQSKKNAEKSNEKSDKKSDDSSPTMNEDTLVIERLEAGQTATFEYAVRPGNLEELPTEIVATYVCTVDPAEDQAKATAKASSSAMAVAKIVRLPAMQLMVIDDEDPVVKGDQVVYSIRVWNEGDAADQAVRLTAELPEGLEFVSADGPTNSNQSGSTIEFDPINSMEPGARADYKVVAKGTGAEAVRFAVKLTSEKLPAAVTAEEPTRLFQR